MKNVIRSVHWQTRSLSATEADVWITVVAENVTPTTEVRGRVTGPRCGSRTTIEVAYFLRPLARTSEDVPPLTMRVIIPEPSLWEPESPFVYRAFVELWQDGERCDQSVQEIGLRMS